jgi:hypothetical protein
MSSPLQPDLTTVIGLTPTVEDYQLDLIQLKDDGFTNLQLQEWLQQHGVPMSISTLERRLQL